MREVDLAQFCSFVCRWKVPKQCAQALEPVRLSVRSQWYVRSHREQAAECEDLRREQLAKMRKPIVSIFLIAAFILHTHTHTQGPIVRWRCIFDKLCTNREEVLRDRAGTVSMP